MDARRLEALYDVAPRVMRLVGGLHDGERITLDRGQAWPSRWLMLEPQPDLMFHAGLTEPDPFELPVRLAYDYISSVNDQGERVYRYVGRF